MDEVSIEPINSARLRREYPQFDFCPHCLEWTDRDPLHMVAVLPDGHVAVPRIGNIARFPDAHPDVHPNIYSGLVLDCEVALCGAETVYSLHLRSTPYPLYLWSWDYLSTREGKRMLFSMFRSCPEMEGKLFSVSTVPLDLLKEYALGYSIISSESNS